MAWNLESQQKIRSADIRVQTYKNRSGKYTKKIVENKENLQEDTYTHLQFQLEHLEMRMKIAERKMGAEAINCILT